MAHPEGCFCCCISLTFSNNLKVSVRDGWWVVSMCQCSSAHKYWFPLLLSRMPQWQLRGVMQCRSSTNRWKHFTIMKKPQACAKADFCSAKLAYVSNIVLCGCVRVCVQLFMYCLIKTKFKLIPSDDLCSWQVSKCVTHNLMGTKQILSP